MVWIIPRSDNSSCHWYRHEECGRLKVPCYDRDITAEEACVLADRAVVLTLTFGSESFAYTMRSRKMVPQGDDGETARLEFDPIVRDGVGQGDLWPALIHAFGLPPDIRMELSGSFSVYRMGAPFTTNTAVVDPKRPNVRRMQGVSEVTLFGMKHSFTVTLEYRTDECLVAPVKSVLEVSGTPFT